MVRATATISVPVKVQHEVKALVSVEQHKQLYEAAHCEHDMLCLWPLHTEMSWQNFQLSAQDLCSGLKKILHEVVFKVQLSSLAFSFL